MKAKKYITAALLNPLSFPWKIFNVLRRKLPIDFWFFKGWSFPPEMITILITKRCNYSCLGCSSDSPQYTRNYKGSELGTEGIKKIIDKVAWFKPGIYFCGGEPTLREDLYELIKYAKNKGLVTAFTTNGSLLTEVNIKKILLSEVDFISASLDGGPKHHNLYRGNQKAYEKLTWGVANLIKQRDSSKLRTPHVRITCIVNPQDTQDALLVLKKAEEMRVDEVAFGNLMFFPCSYRQKQEEFKRKYGISGPSLVGLEVKGDRLPFTIDRKGLDRLYEELKSKAKLPLHLFSKKTDFNKFYSFQEPADNSRCLTPWFVATILPDGSVSVCKEFQLGNLDNNSFMTLWNSEKARKFRRLRRKGIFPACFRCLEGHEIKFN